MKKYALIFAFFSTAHADAALKINAFSLDVKAAEFGVIHAEFTKDDDEVCVVGSYIEDDDARIYGRIMLLSAAKNKILWQKKLPAPGDNVNNSIVGCARQGNYIYAVANVDTDRNRAHNKSLVYVYKFDSNGKQVALENIKVPLESNLAYGLSIMDGDLRIVGLGKDEDAENEYYSMFVSKFNSSLTFDTAILKNGGFAYGSDFKIVNKNIFIGGQFFPAKASKNEVLADYANSKIHLGGGYVWSLRPQRIMALNVFSTVSESADIYSLSHEKTNTFFSVVDPTGKISAEFKSPSLFCKTRSMTTFGDSVLAVRHPCNDPFGKGALVSIGRKNGTEKEQELSKEEAIFVFSNKTNWYVITKNLHDSLSFRVGNSVRAGQ